MAYTFYEILKTDYTADIVIGKTALKEIKVSDEQEKALIEEAEQWDMICDIKGYEKLYWHDNDIIDHSSQQYISNYYGAGMIVRDGHFHGALVNARDTASMGLSVTYREGVGLVCIDGFRDGKTEEHESHGSDEVRWEHNVTYVLKKKGEI